MNAAAIFLRSLSRASATLVAACVLLGSARGEEMKHPVKPFLWKVERADLKKPSFLFGTIHLGVDSVSTLHPAAEAAFLEAKSVHTEIAMSAAAQLKASEFLMRGDGKTLTQSIGPELAKALAEQLKSIHAELGVEPFDNLKTWYVASSLPLLESQLKGEIPLDLQLWERAEKAGKKTAGMQTVPAQVAGFEELAEKDQIALLAETLRYFREERRDMKDSMADIVAVYLSGDTKRVEEEFDKVLKLTLGGRHKELGDRIAKRILNDRDVIMADYIDKVLKEEGGEVHFFAVGTAHYAPDNGVRGYLVKKGYKITRIEK